MAAQTPPHSPQPTRWIAATCVLAAIAIALASTLVIRGSASDEVGESAAGSAAAACALVDQITDDFDGEADKKARLDWVRLSSAESLGMLASAQDDSFLELSDALMEPKRVGGAEFDYRSDKVADAVEDARTACADEGF